ncbi:hypothetical protein AK812_SmicGene14892 [Symbiodinium microadriaticum]|uniref:Uncharacterized protein n=1 Tax=Symbiodinium microadriaticum TaxID=2951 RepID=A0A1Q9E4C7_SYMMI|nr:hypothetical protein AK812_SmicGene14892 [Symbiodinium microadriaticum]
MVAIEALQPQQPQQPEQKQQKEMKKEMEVAPAVGDAGEKATEKRMEQKKAVLAGAGNKNAIWALREAMLVGIVAYGLEPSTSMHSRRDGGDYSEQAAKEEASLRAVSSSLAEEAEAKSRREPQATWRCIIIIIVIIVIIIVVIIMIIIITLIIVLIIVIITNIIIMVVVIIIIPPVQGAQRAMAELREAKLRDVIGEDVKAGGFQAVELVYAVETASAHVEQNIKKQRAQSWVKALEFDVRSAASNWKALKCVAASRSARMSENVYERHDDEMSDDVGDLKNREMERFSDSVAADPGKNGYWAVRRDGQIEMVEIRSAARLFAGQHKVDFDTIRTAAVEICRGLKVGDYFSRMEAWVERLPGSKLRELAEVPHWIETKQQWVDGSNMKYDKGLDKLLATPVPLGGDMDVMLDRTMLRAGVVVHVFNDLHDLNDLCGCYQCVWEWTVDSLYDVLAVADSGLHGIYDVFVFALCNIDDLGALHDIDGITDIHDALLCDIESIYSIHNLGDGMHGTSGIREGGGNSGGISLADFACDLVAVNWAFLVVYGVFFFESEWGDK